MVICHIKNSIKASLCWFRKIKNEIKSVQTNFLVILTSKMSVKMKSRIKTEKYAAYSEIGFPKKSILKPFGLTSPIRQRGNELAT